MSFFDRLVVATLPLVPKPLVGRFSRPYIAGARRDQAVSLVRRLNESGMTATIDVLGEHITTLAEAEAPRDGYLALLDAIHREGIRSNVSVKPTQFGLALDPETCFRNLRAVVARAAELGNFVRLDMEDTSCTDDTLRIYHRLRAEGLENTGVVLQAMLRRTLADAEALGRVGARVRLCKGIYVEPRTLAWRDREIVRKNYVLVLERLVEAGCHVGIATHDEVLVWEALRLVHLRGLPPTAYEFQMLLGVEEELRGILVRAGHPLRVYVPFGEDWHAYSVRRLRENPKLAGTVARAVLRGRRSRD